MHSLYNKKISLILILIFISIKFFSQDNSLLLLKEKRKLTFGIGLGLGNHSLIFDKSISFLNSDSILGIDPKTSLGFSFNLITNYNLSKYFALRSGFPLFHMSYYNINYTEKYPTINTKNFNFDHFSLELPIDIVFKSDIIKNFRFYIFSGGFARYNYTYNSSIKLLQIAPLEYGFETGIGFLFNGELTIFGIELKYQRGISNILNKNPNYIYSNIIESIQTENVLLIINFM